MIIDSINQRIAIMRIRGIGQAGFIRKLNSLSAVLGHGLIQTMEKAERVHRIMLIRGYSGIIGFPRKKNLNKHDLAVLAAIVGVILIWLF